MILKAGDFFDSPRVLDASVTTIPRSSSSPVQVIAATTDIGYGIFYKDNTGAFIGVYVGESGKEQLKCVIGNGDTGTGYAVFPKGCRISLKSLADADVTSGTLTAHLLTL